VAIEAEDFFDAVFSHDGKVDGVSRRQIGMADNNVACTLDCLEVDRQNLVNDFEHDLEARLNGIAAIDRDVAVEYLLKDLRVGQETTFLCDRSFEKAPSVDLVRMLAPDQIHRDIRVDQDHSPSP
jgi:hypothetical protein